MGNISPSRPRSRSGATPTIVRRDRPATNRVQRAELSTGSSRVSLPRDGDARQVEQCEHRPDVIVAPVLKIQGYCTLSETKRRKQNERQWKGDCQGFQLDTSFQLIGGTNALDEVPEEQGKQGRGDERHGEPCAAAELRCCLEGEPDREV